MIGQRLKVGSALQIKLDTTNVSRDHGLLKQPSNFALLELYADAQLELNAHLMESALFDKEINILDFIDTK